MRTIQNGVISIAGFDPSAGAGVLADIKTFEQIGVYGSGIATGITYQNDIKFDGGLWLGFNEISAQFQPLAERFQFNYAKIGLIDSAEVLKSTVRMLINHNPDIKIIWDPVMETSSGVLIHEGDFIEEIEAIISDLFLITPNFEEAKVLGLVDLISKTNVLVTGGQIDESLVTDVLYFEGKTMRFDAEKLENAEKHGSGCVLSAAITAFLSQGFSLEESCQKAKEYTLQFLLNTPGLLGFHHSIYTNEPNAS